MPVRDDDLARALRDAAPAVSPDDAYAGVVAKRTRRRTARRARVGAVAALVVAIGIGGVALATRDEESTRITTPAATTPTPPPAPAPAPVPAGWSPVKLATDEGYLRGPLTLSQVGDRVLASVAAYDRDAKGGFSFPPSHIVRFDPATGRVVDRVDLKAEVLDVVDGDAGVRWALTRNPDPDGPTLPGLFLKRIAADGKVQSIALPPGTTTTGAIEWFAGNIGVVTAGDATGSSSIATFDTRGLPVSSGIVDVFGDSGRRPAGFELVPVDYASSGSTSPDDTREWYQGRQDGVPAVFLGGLAPDPSRVVTFPGATDTSFAWVDDHTVFATSGGQLYRYTLA